MGRVSLKCVNTWALMLQWEGGIGSRVVVVYMEGWYLDIGVTVGRWHRFLGINSLFGMYIIWRLDFVGHGEFL